MIVLKDILLVGAGSFLGGIARYLIALVMKGFSASFPWATMLLNILKRESEPITNRKLYSLLSVCPW